MTTCMAMGRAATTAGGLDVAADFQAAVDRRRTQAGDRA